MDEGNDDHFRACSRLLTLAIRSNPEGFSAMIARSEADQGKERIEITEALTGDDTRIITVKSKCSSWDVSPRELLSDRLKEQLPWYLEDYAQLDPLDTSRAKSIAEELGGYGRRLFNALDFERLRDKLNKSTSLLTISVHHSTHTSAFPETLWEALEEPSLWSDQGIHAQVIVRRVFQGEPRIRVRVRKTFNILYVVARPGMTLKGTNSIDPNAYIDHRLLSKSVVQTISAMQDDSVQVELQMVRPGTFKAFKDHLTRVRDAIGQPGYFDLVHFDMHGRVKRDEKGERYQLGFLDGATLQTEWIDAPNIAQLLKWHGIPAALLNACESANTRQRGNTNLAQALVQHGVAFVVAMSFKLSTSAAQIFLQAFYRKLLAGYPNYNAAVLAGRNALRSEPTRNARLGLRLPVQDWAVPVLYIDTANTVLTANYTRNQLMTMYTLEGELYSPMDLIAPERARAMQRVADSPIPHHVPDLDTVMGVLDPGFIGRDFEILWIETLLCRANILRIYGPPSVGKTCLAKQLGAWWTRTYFSSFVQIIHCSSPDYLSRLDELVAGRSIILGVEMLTAPQPTDPSRVPKPPRILIFDGLDELDAPSVNKNGDLRFSRTCEALPSLMASGTKLVFISRKPRLGLEASRPDSALATTLKEAHSFELKAFSPPDAAAFGSKLLADKGETIGRENVVNLQCIYEELDNLPGAIERVMVHCSLREESEQPRRVLEKLRAGIPLNEIASTDTAMEMINACAAGGVNMQLSMLFIAPFSHRILNSQANGDLLDYLSWPVRYEGFVSQIGASDPAVKAARRTLDEHGRTAEFAGIMTNDSEGVSFTRQYILLGNLLDAIKSFTSLGYIIPETKGSSPALWIHPMLTAFLRHHLRVKIPQMKPRIERSFVHFMLKKKFSPESWIHGVDSIPEPGQVSVREFLDDRIQREPWNYVNAVVLGADLINEEQGGGVVITLVDYLDALRHILIALGGTDAEKWFDVVIPVGERVVNKHFLGPRQEAFTQTCYDKELEAVLSILKDLSDREIRVKRQAGHRSASKYLRQAVDIGERHRLVGKSKDILDRCKDSLQWLTGGEDRPEAPGPADAGLPADRIDLQDLAFSSRYATTGDEAVLEAFRAYLSVLRAVLRSGRVLINGWERQLLESLDIDRNDDEFGEIALAYGRYIDHENDAQLSELCFRIERQMARQSYAEAKRLALNGLERSLDAGNRYGEFDFRRYLVEISECASSEGLGGTAAAQLGVLRALAHTIGIDSAEWCVCWRHIVRAERAVAGKDMVAARKSYLLALQEAYSACKDTNTHFVKVADELAAKEILSEATLRFLELCRQQTLPTGSSYDPKAFFFLLRSLFKREPSSEFFLGSTIFQYDAGALQDLEALSGLSETALLGPLIRAYLVLLDASVAGHRTGEDGPPDLGEIARRQQHSLFCTGGDGDATEATTSTTAATFSVTDQRSSLWMDSQMREAASYADCVKRTIPPWGKFASVRYGITAGDDELIPVIVGPDASDDEVEPERRREFVSRFLRRKHKAQIKQRQKEIEEQKKKTAEVRAKLEKLRIEAEKQEREQVVDELEKDSAIQYQTSRIQERRVGAVIDALRVLLNSGGYPQVVWGIKLRGRGMVGEGAEGQNLPDYSSVERNGMNVWCDCCRVPVGQRVSYVCYYCDFRICVSCWGLGRGCLNRSHLLVEDQYWPSRPSNCPRLRQPELPLWCDNAWCRKSISGFYLHCCCGGAELDFCETCVLSSSTRCFSQLHPLFWGVRPLPMGLSDTRGLCGKGIKYPQEAIQVTAQTTQAWLNTSTRPLVLSRSVFRYKMVEQQLERLWEAQRAGDVIVQLETDISYCDFCLAPTRTKAHYVCQGDHPETGYSGANMNLVICQPCYMGGIRCPSNHAMVYKAATFTNCSREIHAPTFLTCDACSKTMVQETYFHCCREGDDFDVCVDCVLDGWACPNATGDHVLRMFHLVAC